MGTASKLLKEFPDDLCGAPKTILFSSLTILHQTSNIFMYIAGTQQILANNDQTIDIFNQSSTNKRMEYFTKCLIIYC